MKIAVYSCVCGNYEVPKPAMITENECDYYLISDDEQLAPGEYKWISVDSVVPSITMKPKDKNRYCKMHPHEIFPEYDFSIYLDGSIQIVGNVAHYISDVGKSGLAIHRHRRSKCIYIEGIMLIWLGLVDRCTMALQAEKYMRAGIPRNYGMFECGMIVSDLKNKRLKSIYSAWYEEYLLGVGRDQLDLIYTLWKMRIAKDDIGLIGDGNITIDTNPDVLWDRKSHYN